MGHTEIVPEIVAPSQRSSDATSERLMVQCIRYIKLLTCALIIIAVLCIAIIGVLSWHMARSVPCQDDVVTRNELKVEITKAVTEHDHEVIQYLLSSYHQLRDTNSETANILVEQENLIRSLQDDLDKEKQETKVRFEAHDTKFNTQQSAMKMFEELLQIINETMTHLQVELTDDAQNRSEDILRLKVVIEDSFANITSLETEVRSQEGAIKDLETTFMQPSGSGSVFTRWGRQDCPENGTELIYSGYVGGGNYFHYGAAVNYLCLTKQPTWNHNSTIDNSAYLYGTEYEFSSHSYTYFGQNLQNQEPPCGVCRSTRASVIMIPGTNVCIEGWTKEYDGYLVAGGMNHTAGSEYICLDSMATTAEGSTGLNSYGKLMYLVTAKCTGALKCPPYVDGRVVTCVVCTR